MGWMDGGHMAPTRKQHRGLHYKSIQCEPTSWPPDTGGVPIIPPSDACRIPKDPWGGVSRVKVCRSRIVTPELI